MKEFKPTYKVRACIVGSADFFHIIYLILQMIRVSLSNEVLL